jgi:hypothetical protein
MSHVSSFSCFPTVDGRLQKQEKQGGELFQLQNGTYLARLFSPELQRPLNSEVCVGLFTNRSAYKRDLGTL